jgi:hypothetical protein
MTTAPDDPSPTNAPTPVPDAIVGVYSSEADLTAAVKHLEIAKYDMSRISVLGKGMSEERHVVGFETPGKHTARWATWGGLWGWLFGAFFFVPGIGHVAFGGYLLYLLTTTGLGLAGGALAGGLTSVGIPKEGIPKYEADLRADRLLLIVHGTPDEVEQAREVLGKTSHDRLDVHSATAVPSR